MGGKIRRVVTGHDRNGKSVVLTDGAPPQHHGMHGPAIGADFIEAHHLVPLSHIKPGEERAYVADDFAVLCSNCHRMIHRWPDPSAPQPEDINGFAEMVRSGRQPP